MRDASDLTSASAIPRSTRRGAINLLLLVVLVAGCHTMHFDVGSGPTGEIVHERKSFFFWGLTPTYEVDVLEHCPYGATAVREETTFVDGLAGQVTLGIWSLRSSWYHCRVEEMP